MRKVEESKENYLEMILLLEQRLHNVRAVDIANEMGFSKPSVSRAMSLLKSLDYIVIGKDGYIVLTTQGRELAKSVLERHLLLKEYLEVVLGVSAETADLDACRMEHIISDESFEAIKKQLEQVK